MGCGVVSSRQAAELRNHGAGSAWVLAAWRHRFDVYRPGIAFPRVFRIELSIQFIFCILRLNLFPYQQIAANALRVDLQCIGKIDISPRNPHIEACAMS